MSKKIWKILIILFALSTTQLPLCAQKSVSKIEQKDNWEKENTKDLLDSAEIKMKSDLPGAFDNIKSALESSIHGKDKLGEAMSYRMLAKTNFSLEQYDLALDYYEKALSFKKILANDVLNEIHREQGLIFEQTNKKGLALTEYQVALSYALESGLTEYEIATRYDIARVQVELKEHDNALKEYDRIQFLEEQRNNKKGIASSNTAKAEVYLLQDKPAQAVSNYKKVEKIAEETDDVVLKSKSLRNQGRAYRQSKQYNEELNVRKKSLELSTQMNDEEELAEDNLLMGELYMEAEKPKEAAVYIERSVALSTQTGNIEKKSKALKTLSEAYNIQGEYNKALDIYKEYSATIDAIHSQREKKLEANLEIVANVSRKLQRIDLLEQDYEISRRTLALLEKEQTVSVRELSIQRRISYILIIIVFGLTLSTFLIYRSSVQRRKANLLLALRSLRSQMNPHFIFNSLNSVNSYIASNDEKKANKYLSDFSMLMRSVLENSKHDFVPIISEANVIKLYLKLEHSRFAEKFEYKLEIDDELQNSEFVIPPMLIQPYIENAVWHGLRYKEEKGTLDVSLKLEGNHLLATICDDGIGRKKSLELKTKHQQNGSSTGMKNTKSRLEIINEIYKMDYAVTIQDKDLERETGTNVELKIPLSTSDKEF